MHSNHVSCQQQIINQSTSQPQLKQYFPKANQTLITKSIFSQCQVLSIIQKSFIAVHYQGDIFLIDQHAACQKLLYMQKYNEIKCHRPSKKVNKKYCIPNVFFMLLVEKKELIKFLGWQFILMNRQGTFTELKVTKQPYILTQTISQTQLVYYLQQLYDIEDIQQQQQISDIIKQQKQQQLHKQIFTKIDLSQREKQIIAQYSCHHSYRFGDQLSLKKAQQIVRKLGEIQAPFNCPHSRVLISYYGGVEELGLVGK